MTLLAIDPGTTESGWVLLTGNQIISAGKEPNGVVLEYARLYGGMVGPVRRDGRQ